MIFCCILPAAITFAEPKTPNKEPSSPSGVSSTSPNQHKVEGTWLGSLDAFSLELTMIFKIRQNSMGALTAAIDCPEQEATNLPAEKVTFEDGDLRFEVKDLHAVFEGQLKADGSTMEGQWKQGGYVFPLLLRSVSEAEIKKFWEDKSYTKVFDPDKLKEDLDFLFQTIKEVHPNMYAYTSKQDFSKLRDQLYNQISKPVTRLEFYKAVAPVVASLKNGHTLMQPPNGAFAEYLREGGKIFPLEIHWDANRVILKSCICPNDLPLGAEILTIDGQNASQFFVKAARYFPTENKAYNLGILEREKTLQMSIWLEKGEVPSLRLHIKSFDGSVDDYVVKSLNEKEIETEITANKAKYAAVSSKKPDYSYRYLSEHNTGLIEFNLFTDLERFKAFLEETFRQLKEQNVPNLIIDIRNNPGGNSTLGDEFLQYLTDKPFQQFEKYELKISQQWRSRCKSVGEEVIPGPIGSIKSFECGFIHPRDNPLRFGGNVFLLVGPKTGSSASSFASAVKHFRIGTLIGQETGETTVCYGDLVYGTLPHTKLGFSVACKRFVDAGGKEDGRGIIPDYEVKQKPEDTANGVDAVMQFTLNLIKDPNFGIEQKADNQIQIERTEK